MLFLTVLEIVTPIFLLAAIGFGWVRMGYDYPVAFVTRLAMKIAVPCLVFSALARTYRYFFQGLDLDVDAMSPQPAASRAGRERPRPGPSCSWFSVFDWPAV